MNTSFKSRKLLCALALFIVATVFVFIGQTDFQGWSDFVKWVFGIYAAGNVGEHVANKKEFVQTTPGVIIAQDDNPDKTDPDPEDTVVPISPNSPFQVRAQAPDKNK